MRHDKWRLCSPRGTVHFFHSVKDVVALFYFAKCNLSFLGWTSVSWWISMLSLYIFLPKNPKRQRKSAARSKISAFWCVFIVLKCPYITEQRAIFMKSTKTVQGKLFDSKSVPKFSTSIPNAISVSKLISMSVCLGTSNAFYPFMYFSMHYVTQVF